MKEKGLGKKLLSLLLVFTMLTTLIPSTFIRTVEAAEGETTYVLAGSDFQPTDGKTATGVTLVNKILDKIDDKYTTMNGFLFAGDYDYNYSNSKAGKEALQGAVQKVYGTDMDEIYIQGNHDADNLVGSTLTKSGENDADNYGVFVINEQDYMWYNDDENRIKQTANNLDAYLKEKFENKYDEPIFVISHLPLHYCMRTQVGGNDGMHANYIFDVLNAYGAKGLNIVFMFGHNHSHGWDDPYGGAAIFLKHGDPINIAQNSTTVYKEESLNFIYMNSGYISYYRNVNTGAETDLSMTVLAITENDVTFERYTANGVHDLKSKGVANTHASTGKSVDGSCSTNHKGNETYLPNTSTLASGYVWKLNKFEDSSEPEQPEELPVTLTHEETGVTVTTMKITELNVTKTSTTKDGYDAYVTYDINPVNYVAGNNAAVSIALDSSVFDYNRSVFVIDETTGETISSGFENGNVTFVTNHFSEYSVAQLSSIGVDNWIKISDATEASSYFQYTLDTNGKDNNVAYLIVNSSSNSTTVLDNNGTNGVKTSTITSNDGTKANASTQDYEWKFDSRNRIYTSINNTTYYIQRSNSNLVLTTNQSDATQWSISNNNGSYTISYSAGGWFNTTYYLTTSGITTSRSTVKLYGNVQNITTTSTPAEYAGMTGNTSYTIGKGDYASSDAVKEIIKEKIKVYTATDNQGTNSNEISNYSIDGTVNPNQAGTYNLAVTYGGKTLGNITVIVVERTATGISLDKYEGSVERGSNSSATTGSTLTVTYSDGTTERVPVTVGMLKGDYNLKQNGTYSGLTVEYLGFSIGNYTLKVTNVSGNNYPEYPNEGSVKVNKTGTGIDFQASGIAQIELSTSGIPIKKGADVIIMLDTSSSMNDNHVTVNGQSQTRLQVMKTALKNLIEKFQEPGEDGIPLDIRLAIADFNRYYTSSSSNYYINSNDHLTGGSIRTNNEGTNYIYTTNDNRISANAFVNATSITNTSNFVDKISYKSGTNYDYAFDAIYQLGDAITQKNKEEGKDRDLYVIFMSDGAPFQYNYFSAQSGDSNRQTEARYWNNWLQGTMTDSMFYSGARNDYYNEDGKHWMAEAIKGDPTQLYDVIRKNDSRDTNKDNWIQVNGLGAIIYSIGFCLAKDKEITVDSMEYVLSNIASSSRGTYYRTDTYEGLNNVFTAIGGEIAYAATNARFVDQMGDNYNLQISTSTYKTVEGGKEVVKTLTPKIEVITYDIYTRQDYLNGTITEDRIGDRKGTSSIKETVTFNTDGTEAYSDLIYTTDKDGNKVYTNILINGIIYAESFWYNTNQTAVPIDGVNIPTTIDKDKTTSGSTNMLPAETFYWKIGTIQTSELAMRYYVYLDGSMEGERPAGSYATNKYAELYYDNYLGNTCLKETISPVMAWKEANVSYAFYLVDENGNIIVNQTTGLTGSFANKVAVTNPVVYETVLLNSGEEVSSIDIASLGVLPEGYTLYDYDGNTGATYTVKINSNTTGSWNITSLKDKATTYVTQYDPNDSSAYTNVRSESTIGHDYTHTVVWFAVVYKVGAISDAVVIDYGLPVHINVLSNDLFMDNGTLTALGNSIPTEVVDGKTLQLQGTQNLANNFSNSLNTPYGNASIKNSIVEYKLHEANGMEFNTTDKFAYAVKYDDGLAATTNNYYYGNVTVIPATTIYYEDNYLTFKKFTREDTTSKYDTTNPSDWETAGNTIDGVQDEDRPGTITILNDANNVYGYDNAYKNMSTFSMGSSKKITVDQLNYGTVDFEFYGTGFDLISLTSNLTGTLTLRVKKVDPNTNSVLSQDNYIIDTYYGYKYENGEWITTDSTDESALYQIPIIQIEDLEYGYYQVQLIATYQGAFDHNEAVNGYDLYVDAVRIYDPANDGANNEDILDAYIKDNEGWPIYLELREQLIDANSFGSITNSEQTINGAVFIDGKGVNATVSDYSEFGPNNEVYLDGGQSIVFNLDLSSYYNAEQNINVLANVLLGMKSATGSKIDFEVYNVDANGKSNVYTNSITTATDMYYNNIRALRNGTIVITNTSETGNILSLTDIKITFTKNPYSTSTNLITIDEQAVGYALRSLRYVAPTTFAPEVFKVTVDETVEKGTYVNVNTTTSQDVEYVYVNDTLVSKYVNNAGGTRTFKATLPATEVGTMEVYVKAYNVDGLEAETQCYAEVEVTEKTFTPKTFEVDAPYAELINKKFKVTVKTGTDVEYITVNGETFTSFKTNKAKGTRTWTINLTAKEVGKFNVDVVAYDKDNTASETITEVVEITSVKKIIKDIIDWIFG